MEKNILISFIIPVYNAEKFLNKCIDSILNQTYFCNYEIILIDDGSNDHSGELCDSYAEKYKNIIVKHQKNVGQGKARNNGLNLAVGEWVCFIDNDDWLDDNLIQESIEYLKSDVDVIMWAKRDVSKNKKKDYLLKTKEKYILYDKDEEKKELLLNTLNFFSDSKIKVGRFPLGTPWGKFIRRKLMNDYNCRFVCGYGEDRPCMIKVYAHANKIILLNHVFHNYRIHNSTMRKYLPDAPDKYREACLEMNRYVNNLMIKDKSMEEALYHFNIAYFCYYVVQDFCNSKNPQSYFERKMKFLNILSTNPYDNSFKSASLNCLPLKRKLLANLIKRKKFFLIDVMNKLNHIMRRLE